MKLRLNQLTIDPTVDIRQKLDEETIQRYMDSFNELPPVTIFRIDGELLLADGFHRATAAQRLGISEIEAEVKRGSRDDALEFAAYANTRHGRPLSTDERRQAIRRLKLLHPDWTSEHIGQLLGCGEHPVYTVLKADEVKKQVPMGTSLSDRHLEEISHAPKEHWGDIVGAAKTRDWTSHETARAVQNIKDDSLPVEHKRALLRGETEPITKVQGEPAVLPDTLRRLVAEEKEKSFATNLEGALFQLANLRRFTVKEIIDGLDTQRLQSLVRELPAYIEFQQQMLKLAKQRLEIWR
jgi:ParB-like chromosome segregation protein Spo0J